MALLDRQHVQLTNSRPWWSYSVICCWLFWLMARRRARTLGHLDKQLTPSSLPSVFTPRRYSSAVYAVVVCLSLCVSVCLSITRRYCVKTAKNTITQTMRRDLPGTLVFWCQRSRWNSNASPQRGRQMQVGHTKIGDCWQITRYNSKTIQVKSSLRDSVDVGLRAPQYQNHSSHNVMKITNKYLGYFTYRSVIDSGWVACKNI